MKYFAALCIIGIVICCAKANTTAEVNDDEYIKMRDACIEKSGITSDVLKEARAGTYADDDKLAAYFKCMFVKVGFMCPDGTLHPDVMLEKAKLRMDETKAKEIIDTCNAKSHENVDKKAYELFKCFREMYGQVINIV